MNREDTVTLGGEAIYRLRVESAAGRGLRVEYQVRSPATPHWEIKAHKSWDWDAFDYRIAKPVPGKRTRAELLDQLTTLIDELKALEA